MFSAIFSLLNASFVLAQAFLLRVAGIIAIVIIVVVVLSMQKSKPRKTEGNMFCQRCGTQISPQAQFCPRCGCSVDNAGPMYQTQQKSKIAAGLFGIFLGGLGIHNFYLGFKGKAIAQLLISILSFGLLAWVSAIWGLIEGIMILSGSICYDADGVPLKD